MTFFVVDAPIKGSACVYVCVWWGGGGEALTVEVINGKFHAIKVDGETL